MWVAGKTDGQLVREDSPKLPATHLPAAAALARVCARYLLRGRGVPLTSAPRIMASILPSRPRGFGPRKSFAIVSSTYHHGYVQGLVEHTKRELEVIAPNTNVHVYEVPGAFEIPLIVQEVAAKGGIDGVIALGVIIQGETAHAEMVARSVTESLQRIALNNRIPVVHEVLLLQNEEQARVRCLEDEINRGTEAARVAMRMAQVMGDFVRR